MATPPVSRGRPLRALAVSALLLAGACLVFVWEPWHGPILLSLTPGHGIDAGDLPALPMIALALAIAVGQTRGGGSTWPRATIGRRIRAVSATVLGAVLLAGVIDTPGEGNLKPTGGGTFKGRTLHADGPEREPVHRWSHVAVTYDGAVLRLYLDGASTSYRAVTGAILGTSSPLWIGGNRPYGEYFLGVIDEVRIFNRALSPSAVRAEMVTPIPRHETSSAGLVGAYAFDMGSGSRAVDASGNGNTGAIRGATWTPHGRFGDALRFDGHGEVVRVPASASLNLQGSMTLAAWIRPSKTQTGWRTILHRQTDAYFLTAGRSSVEVDRLGAFNYVRVAVLLAVALWLLATLAGVGPPWGEGRGHSSWPPVALFLAGSVADAALVPTTALIGPTLVTLWYALIAPDRPEAASLWLLTVAFTGVTAISLAGRGGLALTYEDGSLVRSAALGLLLVVLGVLAYRREFTGWTGRKARLSAELPR